MPSISVIIPTYNNEKFIAETIESVLSQTYKDYEIIVIDDGSTDNTCEILLPYMDKIRYHYKKNGGIASATNAGIKLSKAKYVAFLDHDDLWVPDKLKTQIECFNKNPKIGLAYSKYSTFKNGKTLRKKPRKGYTGWIFSELISKSFILTSTVMVKTECLDVVGNFDEFFTLAVADELFLRIAMNYQCFFIDKELTKYRIHDRNASRNVITYDKELVEVYKKFYDNNYNLSKKDKKLLKKRIARYSLKVAKVLCRQGQLEESKKYQKEAHNYLPFYKRITSNLIFKT